MATQLEKNRKAAEEKGYIALAREMEQQYGMPAGMFAGLLEQESGWRPDVISGKKKSKAGALGIAQFMPATAEEQGVDPLDPEAAIRAGAKYLAKMKDMAGSWTGGLTAYNWGIGNYRKFISGKKKRQPKESREYANKVQQRAATFRNSAAPVTGANTGAVTQAAPAVDSQSAVVPEAPQPAVVPPVAADPAQALIPPPMDVTPSPSVAPMQQTTPTPIPQPAMPNDPSASLLPYDRTLPQRGQRAAKLEMKKPKKMDVMIDTPAGPRQVQAETPEEEQLVQDLAQSGETQLLSLVPELIQTRDLTRSQPLIQTRGDSVDKLLHQIVKGVT